MIRLERVELNNPGQFFACCGLFELAHRAWGGATAHFERADFVLVPERDQSQSLSALLQLVERASFDELTPSDATASPLFLGPPFSLRLDWWKDRPGGGQALKPWAGTMRGGRIARALRAQLSGCAAAERMLEHAQVVLDDEAKKVEPFYFDARRGSNALARDVGFSADAISMETLATPATEFLALVGLQRFRPSAERRPRVFTYRPWSKPLPIVLAPLAICGALADPSLVTYRFENAFRTDQRKHKAFSPAVPVSGDRNE